MYNVEGSKSDIKQSSKTDTAKIRVEVMVPWIKFMGKGGKSTKLRTILEQY